MEKEGYSIRPYTDADLDLLKNIIKTNWNSQHVFLQSDSLLKWQYEGYGKYHGMGFPLLFAGKKLIGFRGLIPVELRLVRNNKECIEPLVVSAMYLVIPEYRGMKLGLALQQYTIETYRNYFAIASNLKTSAPIHRKSHSFMLDKMYRYLLPLCNNYSNLLIKKDVSISTCIPNLDVSSIEPIDISSEKLEDFWLNSINDTHIVALNRSRDFWDWRYHKSPIYSYLFFGGEELGGIVVGRICDIFIDSTKRRKEKIFRILELIPNNSRVWSGEVDESLTLFLHKLSVWAFQNGCVGIEFYTSTSRFQSILNLVGFQEVNYGNSDIDIISYYEPMSFSPRLSNISLFLSDSNLDFTFEDTYFTLSDADQDRPNIIPNNYV